MPKGFFDDAKGYINGDTKAAALMYTFTYTASTEVAAGAADGTVAGYYQVQQNVFVAAGAAEATPVEDYVMLQNMIDAAK